MRNATRVGMMIVLGALAALPAQAQGTWVKKYDAKRVTGIQVVSLQLLAAAAEDSILLSLNSGENWQVRLAEPDANLRDVHIFDQQNGWAVGSPGVVLQIKVSVTGPGAGRLQGLGETDFQCVYFRDANTGWVGGAGGRLLATKDGGVTWSSQTFQLPQGSSEGADASVQAVVFPTEQNGVAVLGGKALVYTEDGGKEWRPLGFPENVMLEDLTRQGQALWLAGGRRLTPTLTVGMLWRSDDFGKTWKTVAVGELYGAVTSVWFADANTGFITVKGKLYATRDAGATWTEASDGTTAIDKVIGADANNLWGLSGGAIYRYTAGGAAPPPASGSGR
ncbi:MAG: YCF48-related protein [Candidatus Acidiferrales bacterium]